MTSTAPDAAPSPARDLIWPRTLPDFLENPIAEVLSIAVRPWEIISIANAYRAFGAPIPAKAEAECAFVIHHLLGFALEHGVDWKTMAGEHLRAPVAALNEQRRRAKLGGLKGLLGPDGRPLKPLGAA